jgi:hypothetical protein
MLIKAGVCRLLSGFQICATGTFSVQVRRPFFYCRFLHFLFYRGAMLQGNHETETYWENIR